MFTTVASSTTMSCAMPTIARVSQRRREGVADADPVVGATEEEVMGTTYTERPSFGNEMFLKHSVS